MAHAFGLGVILRIDTMGWDGAPPVLTLGAPFRSQEGRGGEHSFFYDLSPKDSDVEVPQLCARLGTRLSRALIGDANPFADKPIAARAVLEVGLLAAKGSETIGYSWPVEFLQVLADAEIELSVTHYLVEATEGDGASGLIVED